MIDPEAERFIASYMDCLQIFPSAMQTEISAYLQSDLQHQHLMKLCKRCVADLKNASSPDTQKELLKKIVLSLTAIQDICDRRIAIMDDLHELLELQKQKLLSSKEKLHISTSQSAALQVNMNSESELDLNDVCDEETRGAATLALLRRGTGSDDPLSRLVPDETEVDYNTEVKFRGKSRMQFRTSTRLSRAGTSRRSLNRWDSGTHRRTSNNSRILGDERERRPNAPYPRYARVQQHRLKNQQRILSRALHANRKRSFHNSDSTTRRVIETKGNLRSSFQTGVRNLSSKVARVSCANQSLLNGSDWSELERSYFEHSTDQHTRTISSDEEKDTQKKLDSSVGSIDRNDVNGSEELEFNYIEEDDADTNSAVCNREAKLCYGKDQRSIGHRLIQSNSRRLCRSRKATDNDAPKNERLQVEQSSDTNNYAGSPADSSNGVHRSTVTGLSYNTNNGGFAKRRERNLTPLRVKQNSPEHPGASVSPVEQSSHRHKGIIGIPGTLSGHSADRSISPDERLYCICKKLSFGDMIACDNKFCPVEWFHFGCVDIYTQPKGKWFCPFCRGDTSRIKRPDV